MRVAFVGCRDWTDGNAVERALIALMQKHGRALVVVTGCASGADKWARELAKDHGFKPAVHRADWDRLGKRAGPERNGRVVADCDAMVAFWDGESDGTRDAIEQAVRAGKPVRIVPRRST